MTIKRLLLLCLLVTMTLLGTTNQASAQKEKKEKEPKKVKVAKGSGNSVAAIMVQLSSTTREEKNTMDRCPLHNRHMSLSDNYRADASDYTPGEEYPFAYQLNYRRYCNVCTRIMAKEAKAFEEEDKEANKEKATFERCELHATALKGNPDHSKNDYEKNPSPEMPHAKQYLFKNYCKVCTKVYKIKNP